WDIEEQGARVLLGHAGSTSQAEFVPGSGAVVATGAVGVVRRWTLSHRTGRTELTILPYDTGRVRYVGLSEDGNEGVAASGHRLSYFDRRTGVERRVEGPWAATTSKYPAISLRAGIMIAPILDETTIPWIVRAAGWELGRTEPLWTDPPSAPDEGSANV